MNTTKQAREKEMAVWFSGINMDEVDNKAQATVDYVKRFMEPEDGNWTVFAYEIASGAHGQFTVRVFLDEVIAHGKETYMSDEFSHEDYTDVIMERFDEASRYVADLFNTKTNLPGKYYVGHNEADGSLGVFYSVKA